MHFTEQNLNTHSSKFSKNQKIFIAFKKLQNENENFNFTNKKKKHRENIMILDVVKLN